MAGRCTPIDVFDFPSTGDQPYQMNWVDWLQGAILTGSTWVVTGATGLIELHGSDFSLAGATVAQVWVRGLNQPDGGMVFVTNQISASDGRTFAATWRFDVCTP